MVAIIRGDTHRFRPLIDRYREASERFGHARVNFQMNASSLPHTKLMRASEVLGTLVAEPFRTRERTPLADPSGKSCGYLTAGHRVLVVTPVWNYGGIELSAARMVGGMVKQVADLPGIEGDTLEGAWDEAVVDLAGELLASAI